jgi:alkylation response protein AidB-like acyl-CoA dehydrogenase
VNLALSAEQQQFAASLHEMLAAADVPAAARSWAAGDRKPGLEVWQSLAEAGVTGLLVPPEHGGLGADPADLVIACEEIGHHAVPGPAAESLAAVPVLLAGAASGQLKGIDGPSLPLEGQRRSFAARQRIPDWLAGLASGELIATLAAPPWLPYAADAECSGLVLLAEPGRLSLAQAGQARRSVDPTRTLTEVTAGGTVADGPEMKSARARALDFGALACAAQLLGIGRGLLELAAEHARQRVQFGQPVGAFQAVKHHLADVAIALEFARPLLLGAAVTLGETVSLGTTGPETSRDVSAAKLACADAASLAARMALQVHGAIGYTAEHDLSLFLTKARALAPAWGSQADHRARVLAAITGAGG